LFSKLAASSVSLAGAVYGEHRPKIQRGSGTFLAERCLTDVLIFVDYRTFSIALCQTTYNIRRSRSPLMPVDHGLEKDSAVLSPLEPLLRGSIHNAL
jgi:hypothetical protein